MYNYKIVANYKRNKNLQIDFESLLPFLNILQKNYKHLVFQYFQTGIIL